MHFHSLSRQNFIGRVSLQTFWSSSSCAAVKTKHDEKKKKNTAQNKNVRPCQNVWCWLLTLSCFVLVWKVTWPEEQQPMISVVLPEGREDRTCVMLFHVLFFVFFSELGEGKKKRHVDHIFWTRWAQETPSEALMEPQPVLVHGNHSSLH